MIVEIVADTVPVLTSFYTVLFMRVGGRNPRKRTESTGGFIIGNVSPGNRDEKDARRQKK